MNPVLSKTSTNIDPYWDAYFQWPEDYFPFNLPACSLTMQQSETGIPDEATITWDMDYNLQLECGLVSEERNILHILHPKNGPTGNAFTEVHKIEGSTDTGKIGFTFTWAFFIPIPDYMPKHPMGIIKIDFSKLAGKNTIITIRDTRPKNQ